MSDKFYGTGVALVTPFHQDGSLDETGLANLVNHVIDGGVEYLVVLGTTGESATQSKEEKKRILEVVKTINDGRRPIVLGVGGNNTEQVIHDIRSSNLDGVDAILSVSPYYNKPTQEGIYQHYKAIAEMSPLPIILYNVPGRTSSNISAVTTLRLAEDFDNIIAVKEASGDMDQIMEIIQEKPDDFLVISGDDNLTFPMIALGGAGVISVSGQGFPAIFSQMVRDALAGKIIESREAHYKLFEITRMMFAEGNPGGIKAILHHIGICSEHMRLPLWPISDGLRNSIIEETDRILK